jgi:hypothetical protein
MFRWHGVIQWKIKSFTARSDVIRTEWSILIYLFAFLVGLPILWANLIIKYKRLIDQILCFGRNQSEKISNFMENIQAAGISLFRYYKSPISYWWFFMLTSQFNLTFFPFSKKPSGQKYLSLFFLYLTMCILNINFQPHLFPFTMF